jgi:hypothetical protein
LGDRKSYASYSTIDAADFPMKIADWRHEVMKNSATAHKRGSIVMRRFVHTLFIAAMVMWSAAVSLRAAAQAPSGEIAVTCTNPYSGASWQIHIDYDRRTVDANPAEISEQTISWRAQNGWHYTLDRTSGKLTVILASATGGNFLYDQCKLDR